MTNTTEIMVILTALSTTFGTLAKWWVDRQDARSVLSLAKTEADKTVVTLQAAVETKNAELASKNATIGQRDARIVHLESLLFSKDGGS
jgi:hypothetical protein